MKAETINRLTDLADRIRTACRQEGYQKAGNAWSKVQMQLLEESEEDA